MSRRHEHPLRDLQNTDGMRAAHDIVEAIVDLRDTVVDSQEKLHLAMTDNGDKVGELTKRVGAVEGELRRINGSVQDTIKDVGQLPCKDRDTTIKEHDKAIAILQERVGLNRVRWDRVWAIAQPIVIAIILIWIGLK